MQGYQDVRVRMCVCVWVVSMSCARQMRVCVRGRGSDAHARTFRYSAGNENGGRDAGTRGPYIQGGPGAARDIAYGIMRPLTCFGSGESA